VAVIDRRPLQAHPKSNIAWNVVPISVSVLLCGGLRRSAYHGRGPVLVVQLLREKWCPIVAQKLEARMSSAWMFDGVVIDAGLDDDAQAARALGIRKHVRISESLVNPLKRRPPCFGSR
jgi:hypothetical protein